MNKEEIKELMSYLWQDSLSKSGKWALEEYIRDLQSQLEIANKKLEEIKEHVDDSLNFYLNDKDLDTPELRVMKVSTFKERYLKPLLSIIGE